MRVEPSGMGLVPYKRDPRELYCPFYLLVSKACLFRFFRVPFSSEDKAAPFLQELGEHLTGGFYDLFQVRGGEYVTLPLLFSQTPSP